MAKNILVVDDAYSLRQLVAFTLKGAGFHVVEGANGQEGLDQPGSNKIDLIITDLNMPVMDGMTFVRRLRQKESSKYTPVLMLTAESQTSIRQGRQRRRGQPGGLLNRFSLPGCSRPSPESCPGLGGYCSELEVADKSWLHPGLPTFRSM